MDEFGRPVDRIAEDGDQGGFGNSLYPPTEHDLQPVGPRAKNPPPHPEPPSSSAPFSTYRGQPEGVVNLDLETAQKKFGNQPQQPEDDGGAGCCKCVVM